MTAMAFQQKIYPELDRKLRLTPFNGGAPEAHGLLTGLACRGITVQNLQNKLYLFQFNSDQDSTLLQGLFELILRDLQSSSLTYRLLLPDDGTSPVIRTDEIANWCGGYMQGFLHDGDSAFSDSNGTIREILQDIMDMGGLYLEEASPEEAEKSITEIEEYLRVGVQLIYDEITGAAQSGSTVQTRYEPENIR